MPEDVRSFDGVRVLLVEDNFLVGTAIRAMLQALGCTVLGPYATAADAEAAFDSGGADCGVLDINIRGGTSESVATKLAAARVPYFFVTGYRSPVALGQELRDVLRVPKPIDQRPLEEALSRVLPA